MKLPLLRVAGLLSIAVGLAQVTFATVLVSGGMVIAILGAEVFRSFITYPQLPVRIAPGEPETRSSES